MNQVTPSFEAETGQVTLWGSSAGVAGEAFLTPVPDLELAFDRADGWFCWAIVHHVTTAGSTCVGEQVAAMLIRLFGPEAPGVVRDAAMLHGPRAAGNWCAHSRPRANRNIVEPGAPWRGPGDQPRSARLALVGSGNRPTR